MDEAKLQEANLAGADLREATSNRRWGWVGLDDLEANGGERVLAKRVRVVGPPQRWEFSPVQPQRGGLARALCPR
ncbi:hypothetical protein ISF26_22730 [Gloeobacter morelensis MG652769]|uniref:Pentapeptide repeat-containing protein n=1 Tax=Gloeobacter morelensis MG652769 TaxID=2781736 RepID=A0ABY3PLG7_9CYAN|nr:hypothetical protein ISF26_22730 [Gloeobacter morelensis MG652769]